MLTICAHLLFLDILFSIASSRSKSSAQSPPTPSFLPSANGHLMSEKSAPWLRWIAGMGERRKLGDVAMDLLLFAGMVSRSSWPAR